MSAPPDLLIQYGVAVLFAWAFAVQAGVPAPAVPMLLGAGALSGAGQMNLAVAVGATMLATLGADAIWYTLGRHMGTRVLGAVCRFSLDPDSLIREAKERFLAHRGRYLVLAKFLPGMNPVAAGLAGAVAVRPDRFLLYAACGAFFWSGIWITLGYACADFIGFLARQAARAGKPVTIVVVALIVFVAFKYVRRRRFLRHLRQARISAAELKQRLDAGDHLVIVDLRTAFDIEAAPYKIPGARVIDPSELRHPGHTIPRDSEIVFYCAEPREATSARVALRAAAIGFHHVHPLLGRLEAWRQAGFPVEPLPPYAAGTSGARRTSSETAAE